MSSILIKGAEIIAMDAAHGAAPFTGDILIENDRIKAVGDLGDGVAEKVISGAGKLAMPGLVNGHMHSPEALYKGRYDNMPLEIWMLYAYPILAAQTLPPRLVYLRTALCAIESLKTGTTMVVDDVYESPKQTREQLDAVFDAYDDVGLRAVISGHVVDRPFLDTIPFARELTPPELQAKADAGAPPSIDEYLAHCAYAFETHHDRSGRLRFMLAPSAPQRCTPEIMQAASELARRYETPFHTHILETKVQGVTGQEFYGETLIAYMHRLGLLHSGVTIAHSIWVTDADIELMGEAGVSIVHNVISNQKLGAGVAPVRRLLEAGVNVALGSDGVSTSDTTRMFAVMHAAGLIHNVQTPHTDYWLSAEDVLRCATLGGAKSARLGDETGSLEPGKKADLLLLDLSGVPFTPMNDLRNHLVYCETGSSIELSIVNGEIVAEHGECLRVKEAELLAELREEMPAFQAAHAETEAANRAFEPYFWRIHKRCQTRDLGIHRLGAEPSWPGAQKG